MSARRVAMRKITATHCPVPTCGAWTNPLLDGDSVTLSGVYLLERAPQRGPVITSFMYGVPKKSDLETYLYFTHLYAAAPTQFLTPGESWVLLRYRGTITHAKQVLGARYNERRRRTDDPTYRSAEGSSFMPPGHVIHVGDAIPIHDAFPWIAPRHRDGLAPGGIRDPTGGEPFHWQSALVVPTSDGRRKARAPFTVIRVGDTQIPSASSRVERQLSDALVRLGVRICPHLESIRLPGGTARPDMVIPHKKLIVEYDGSYWHHGPKRQ